MALDDSGINEDRKIDVSGTSEATFSLAHAWGCGAKLAIPECLHVWHYGWRDEVDPDKIAAFAHHPFAEGPLTLENFPALETVIELCVNGFQRDVMHYAASGIFADGALISNRPRVIAVLEKVVRGDADLWQPHDGWNGNPSWPHHIDWRVTPDTLSYGFMGWKGHRRLLASPLFRAAMAHEAVACLGRIA